MVSALAGDGLPEEKVKVKGNTNILSLIKAVATCKNVLQMLFYSTQNHYLFS